MAESALIPRLSVMDENFPAGPAVTITRCTTLHIAGIAARPGHTLPLPGQSTAHGALHVIWSGHHRWLALGPHPIQAADLGPLTGPNAILTDLTDSRVILRITGPAARETLTRLIPLDLHDTAFPPFATALTLAAHIAVQLWRDQKNSYLLLAPVSYAASLLHALRTACAPLNATP